MELRMSPAERAFFVSFLSCAKSYLEFGAGGSTVLASEVVKGPVYSIESDAAWIEAVRLASPKSQFERKLIFADIGPTKEWGVPIKGPDEVDYRNYYHHVWENIEQTFDLYFIDGRFRVACMAEAILHGNLNSIFIMHDYRSRPFYHAVESVAYPIAETEDITAFRRRPDAHESPHFPGLENA